MINTEESAYMGKWAIGAILQPNRKTECGNQEPKKLSQDVISEEKAEAFEAGKIIPGL